MGISGGPSIIRDSSLVLAWDITDKNSYPGSGNTIFDLSGNRNNGTITGGVTYNAATFNGVLTTNGTTGYISSTTPNLASTNYTVIGAARYNGATRGRMINATSNNWLLGHWSGGSTPGTANYYAEGWVSSAVASSGPNDTLWRIYTGTGNIGGDSYALYVNSVLTDGPNTGGSAGPNGITVGGYAPGNSEYSTGDFSFLLMYNRILSATEIQQNYNAQKSRFGLI
jgi:hypothetical protein